MPAGCGGSQHDPSESVHLAHFRRRLGLCSLSRVSHFHIRCPNCGPRPASEFGYGGEVRPAADPALTEREEIERLWLRRNVAGPQRERWFHTAGCRRYLTLTRDTRDNAILVEPGATDDRTGDETTTSAGELRPPT